MKKVINLLNRYNKNYLYQQKSSKKLIKKYKKAFLKQNLYFKVKDDFDYIHFLVILTSYQNMLAIQNKYFNIKAELRELWDVIDYQEKLFLVYQQLDPYLDELKAFYIDDKRYFITYFDFLMNAYYDHDMLLFENPAYQKFLYNFQKLVNVKNTYDFIPLKSNFTHLDLIVENQNGFVMYDKLTNRLYVYQNQKFSVGLSNVIKASDVKIISEAILNNDKALLVNYLIDNNLASKSLLRKLKRIKRKMDK